MKGAKITIIIILVASLLELRAQTNFLPGYYVKMGQDTVKGFIENRSETRNTQFCVFRADQAAAAKTMLPGEISSYSVAGKTYETHHVKSKKKKNEVTAFLRVLISGKISLYAFESRYFAQKDGDMFEISRTTEIVDGQFKDDYFGLGKLKVAMMDCPTAGFSIKSNFSVTDFREIILKYNQCSNASYREESAMRQHLVISVGLQASSAWSSLKLMGISGTNQNSALVAKGGLLISMFIPKMSENIRAIAEVSYGKFDSYSFFEDKKQLNSTNNDLFIKYSFVEVPLLLSYTRKHFFFDAGIANQFIVDQQMSWRKEVLAANAVSTLAGNPDPLMTWSKGLLCGIGYSQRLLGHECKCSVRYSALLANPNSGAQKYNTFELKISYLMGK